MSFVKDFFNYLADPRLFFILGVVGLALLVWKREQFVSDRVGYGLLAFLSLFFLFGAFDPNFRLIITKPDNVPIVGLIFLLVFFTWYSMREGVKNDRRLAEGQPPVEKDEADRVWVWPDLVYTELISLILCSVVLIVWSIFLKAPLEQPANRSVTPNPSKAPWYFLGLQEMLVYFDPWLAGVVLPGLIIVGLIAIPYIDRNPKGNGYYTFAERKAEITIFLFGFVILWSSLIVLGTFLRGPNWNFFGPFEYLGHPQARSAHQRQSLRIHLGEGPGPGTSGPLAHPGELWHPRHADLCVRVARLAVETGVPDLLREAGPAALLRDGVPVSHDDVAAGEDASSLDFQPEVHRGDSGVLLQHLNRPAAVGRPVGCRANVRDTPWLRKRLSGTPITSTS